MSREYQSPPDPDDDIQTRSRFKFVTLEDIRIEHVCDKPFEPGDLPVWIRVIRGPGVYSALGARITELLIRWLGCCVDYIRPENYVVDRVETIKNTPLIHAPIFHLSQTPQHVQQIVAGIRTKNPHAEIIWEPAPEPIEKQDIPYFKQVLGEISILYLEVFQLAALSGTTWDLFTDDSDGHLRASITEAVKTQWISHMRNGGTIIICARTKGYYIFRHGMDYDSESWMVWLPPCKVSDQADPRIPGPVYMFPAASPGSAFLGVLAYAWGRLRSQGTMGIVNDAKVAAVAASFVVQQESFPVHHRKMVSKSERVGKTSPPAGDPEGGDMERRDREESSEELQGYTGPLSAG
ncbi:hypothetical protein B0T19DRAFT_446274 [Cercophora scortea]|uniref:Uncharacterized protein n=1 Tax=Cercophora scortea TaxID=314031 RepID=A0AAE0I2Q7_9PEZI|nr:hypothetical protein B0T19DRAFT_446274 [Cercophora scortea]